MAQEAGVPFTEGTKHTIVHLNGRFTEIRRHPWTEIKTGTHHAILKQLGLKK